MTTATRSLRNITFELCVGGIDDVVLAACRSVDRIELNCGMAVGGLTPTLSLASTARSIFSRPMIAMIRPREGGFVYSDAEFRQMLVEAEGLLNIGIDGLALGFLTSESCIDVVRCQKFRRRFPTATLVFHKAFDFVPDRAKALQQLIECNYQRVLTSGGARTAIEGRAELSRLKQLAGDRIEILPGGGIRAENVELLVRETGLPQIHSAAREVAGELSSGTTSMGLGMPGCDDFHYGRVSSEKLDALLVTVETLRRTA